MARRGRPPLDDLARMEAEGRYLHARYTLGHRLDPPRAPTIEEIAEEMGVSARTVETIRSGMRTWRRETYAGLGWDAPDDGVDTLDALTGWTYEDDLIRAMHQAGSLSTREAADRLGRDERTLRKRRSESRRSE